MSLSRFLRLTFFTYLYLHAHYLYCEITYTAHYSCYLLRSVAGPRRARNRQRAHDANLLLLLFFFIVGYLLTYLLLSPANVFRF